MVRCIAPKPGCKREYPKDLNSSGCLKYMCGRDDCKDLTVMCPVVKCARIKFGCKREYLKLSKLKDKRGCLTHPCGIDKCRATSPPRPKPGCPMARCAQPKAGCIRTWSKELKADGCLKHLCGKVLCKRLCPVPLCA